MNIDMTTIPKFRVGEITGVQTEGPTFTETTRWWKCEACNGFFDVFDFASALSHEGPLPHPAADQLQ